jgi:hypothetical protein
VSQESYARAARLVYIVRHPIDGPERALIQAHRRAAAAVATHPDDDDAAVREALRSVIEELDHWRSGWSLRGPRLTPAGVTTEQHEVLERIKAADYHMAAAAVLHLLEGTAIEDVAAVIDPEHPDHCSGSVREAVTDICGDRARDEVRELLLSRELDPMVVPVSARAVLERRRRRIRAGGAMTAAVVLLAAAGVWWFGVRVRPLGSFGDDPQIQSASRIGGGAYGLDAWPARGELLGDAALLRRAAARWRDSGLPSDDRPQVIFAGRVHDVPVVVMTVGELPDSDAEGVAVYAEHLGGKMLFHPIDVADATSRIMVNPVPASDPAGPGAIRLLDSTAFNADPILLPPTVSDVQTGPLDTPSEGWQPARPDARGVLEVPVPTVSLQQEASSPSWSPSQGIRFAASNDHVIIAPAVTVPETFKDAAPVLPVIGSDYSDHQALSAADWCAARKQAEIYSGLDRGYSVENLSDIADGPLPDGAGTGYVIARHAVGAQHEPFDDVAVLAESGSSCATALFQPGLSMTDYAITGGPSGLNTGRSFASTVTDAVMWTSPANHSYLIVAAAPGVAKLRLSGPVSASADGRWLVAPLPSLTRNGQLTEPPLVEAFDAAGHRCGDPDPRVPDGQYCYKEG